MKVCERADRLRDAGVEALFVVHDEPAKVRAQLLAGIEPSFPVLVDEDRQAYDVWGLRRARRREIWLDPQVWRSYAALLRSGERIRGAGKDALQLGGDFVVDPSGVVVFSRPQQRDDRPAVGHLERAARDAGA